MGLIYFCIGLAASVLVLVVRTRLTGFSAQSSEDYVDDTLVLEMRKHLAGEMVCEGVIFGPTGRVSSSFVADFNVTWDGDNATIEEHFVYHDKSTQDRCWHIRLGSNGRFDATAPDVPGVGTGRVAGSTIHMRYPIKLPDDIGSHVLQTVDWIYLTSDGSLVNRSQFRKFGIKVAELVATIRKKDIS